MSGRGVEIGLPKEKYRQAFVVPATSGNYASERITFGAVSSGQIEQYFRGIMALAEGPLVTGCTVELWLRKVADSTEAASAMDDLDYTLAGTNFTPLTVAGGIAWTLHAWPGAQIRVKSGGTQGTQNVSAAAY